MSPGPRCRHPAPSSIPGTCPGASAGDRQWGTPTPAGSTPLSHPHQPNQLLLSPPSSHAFTGVFISTSFVSGGAFSSLLKTYEADHDSPSCTGTRCLQLHLGQWMAKRKENLPAPLAAISSFTPGSLFQVTLNFLLSIVALISDGSGGERNSYYLIAFKISNKPEQRLSPPNLSFLVVLLQSSLLGNCRGCGSSHPYCASPQRPQSCGQSLRHLPTSPRPASTCLGLPLVARCKTLGPRYSQLPGRLWGSQTLLGGSPAGSQCGHHVWHHSCHHPALSLSPPSSPGYTRRS